MDDFQEAENEQMEEEEVAAPERVSDEDEGDAMEVEEDDRDPAEVQAADDDELEMTAENDDQFVEIASRMTFHNFMQLYTNEPVFRDNADRLSHRLSFPLTGFSLVVRDDAFDFFVRFTGERNSRQIEADDIGTLLTLPVALHFAYMYIEHPFDTNFAQDVDLILRLVTTSPVRIFCHRHKRLHDAHALHQLAILRRVEAVVHDGPFLSIGDLGNIFTVVFGKHGGVRLPSSTRYPDWFVHTDLSAEEFQELVNEYSAANSWEKEKETEEGDVVKITIRNPRGHRMTTYMDRSFIVFKDLNE